MREIKFRAWDGEHLLKDFLVAGAEFCNAIGVLQDEEYAKRLYAVKEWKLMQYTGLKDKNGKEIYEGDIVKYDQVERFGESRNNYQTTVEYKDYGFTPMKYHTECEDDFYSCLIENIEVIGNIYENPDLLND